MKIHYRFAILIIGLWVAWIMPLVIKAQNTAIYDVFASRNIKNNQSGVYFVNQISGLTNTVITNGSEHTRFAKGVIFLDGETRRPQIVYSNGQIERFALIADSEVSTNETTRIRWIVSADQTRIAWTLSTRQGETLLSDLFIASSLGNDRTLILHTSSTKNIDTIPLAISNDGSSVFYARQVIDQAENQTPYILFETVTDVFKLDVQSGTVSELPGKTDCRCAVGFTSNGNYFARLEPDSTDQQGFNLKMWDFSFRNSTTPFYTIPAPTIIHRQAGHVLIAADGNQVVYVSARGVAPAQGVPPERFAILFAEANAKEQRLIVTDLRVNLRPIAFERGKNVVLLVGTTTDGTYKLLIKEGTLIQVSSATYLGTLS